MSWTWRQLGVICAVYATVVLVRQAVAAPPLADWNAKLSVHDAALQTTMEIAPGVGGNMHRMARRAERSMTRAFSLAGSIGALWIWFVFSALVFLLVTALSSVADLRLFDLRHYSPGAISQYFAHGVFTFVRILLDRRTPYLPRFVLAAALLYWLVPADFIPDNSLLPGFVDDVIIAILAAKGFMYLCPDSIVARHAALQARA